MAIGRTKRFRWLILFLIVPIIISSEIFWLTFAPVASTAMGFFRTNALGVDLFSMSYMLMYIVLTIPASWVIEKYGFRAALVIGSLLTCLFGLARFLFAENYGMALAAQFCIAAGQPFLVNISTKVPANWFPVEERATASGILVMAQYIGFVVPMVASPMLADQFGIKPMLGVYAAIAFISAVPAVFFTRERPEVPPGPPEIVEPMSLKILGRLLRNWNFALILIISFISMGLFNTLLTKIEPIFKPRDISAADAGMIGAALVVSGIVGAIFLPLLSDKTRRRVPLLISGICLLGLLCAGLAAFRSYTLLLITGALLGFIIMGLAPILFQHGAEVAYPVQEGASFGLIMLMGQISGVAFIYIFERIQNWTASVSWPMVFLITLAVLQIPLIARIKESPVFLASQGPNQAMDPAE